MKTVTSHRGQPLRLNIQFCLEFSHPLHKVGSFTGEGTDSVHGLRSHSSLWTELVFEPHPQLLLQGEWEIKPPGSGWGEDPGRHFQETLPVVTEALCHDRNKLSPMWPLAPWAPPLDHGLLKGWDVGHPVPGSQRLAQTNWQRNQLASGSTRRFLGPRVNSLFFRGTEKVT